MQRSTIVIVVAIILVAFLLYRTRKATPTVAGGKKWTVYGTKGCGWTVKQLDYMKKAGKPHVFVDCDKDECKGMKAFPTLVSPEGEKTVGYKEV
jgi:hypothetical protein